MWDPHWRCRIAVVMVDGARGKRTNNKEQLVIMYLRLNAWVNLPHAGEKEATISSEVQIRFLYYYYFIV